MDKTTTVDGPKTPASHVNSIQNRAQSDLSSHARHALEGCLFGLTPNPAQTHVQPGEAYVAGNRLRLREDEAIDIAGLTRPTGSPGGVGDGAGELRDGRLRDGLRH